MYLQTNKKYYNFTESFLFINMTTKFYSYSSSSSYSNINGDVEYKEVEMTNNNGKKKGKAVYSKNGKTKKMYFNDKMLTQNTNKLLKHN